jgi:hypothetical protein
MSKDRSWRRSFRLDLEALREGEAVDIQKKTNLYLACLLGWLVYRWFACLPSPTRVHPISVPLSGHNPSLRPSLVRSRCHLERYFGFEGIATLSEVHEALRKGYFHPREVERDWALL